MFSEFKLRLEFISQFTILILYIILQRILTLHFEDFKETFINLIIKSSLDNKDHKKYYYS